MAHYFCAKPSISSRCIFFRYSVASTTTFYNQQEIIYIYSNHSYVIFIISIMYQYTFIGIKNFHVYTFWFYNQLDYLNFYILSNSWQTKLKQIYSKVFIFSNNIMLMKGLLLFDKFSKYTFIMIHYYMIRPSKQLLVKNMDNNSFFIPRKNALLISILCFCDNSCATNHILYQTLLISWAYLILNIYFKSISFQSISKLSCFHIW